MESKKVAKSSKTSDKKIEQIIEMPIIEEQIIEVPVIEEPVVEMPIIEEPVVEVPVIEPVIEPVVKSTPSTKSIKEICNECVLDGKPYKIYLKTQLIFESVNHKTSPQFFDNYFTLFNKRYGYRGIKFEKC